MNDDYNESSEEYEDDDPEAGGNTDFLVTVFRTDSQGTAAVARSVLEEAGIEYLVKGEGLQNLVGYGIIGQVYNDLSGLIEFQVMPDDEKLAVELLANLEESPMLDETNIIDESIPENNENLEGDVDEFPDDE